MRRESEILQVRAVRDEVLRQLHEALASDDGATGSLADLALMALCDSSGAATSPEHE